MSEAKRGYSIIGLINPKTNANVGGVLRAAYCYSSHAVIIQGHRYSRHASDTMAAEKHLPLHHGIISMFTPRNCKSVVIEIDDNATSLLDFVHPERAVYIFGPEDGSVPRGIQDASDYIVSIPTRFCMNLASAVNVVLYDRMLKSRLECRRS